MVFQFWLFCSDFNETEMVHNDLCHGTIFFSREHNINMASFYQINFVNQMNHCLNQKVVSILIYHLEIWTKKNNIFIRYLEFWLHYLWINSIFSSIWEWQDKYSQEYERTENLATYLIIFRGNRRFVQKLLLLIQNQR
jgi:hypothetical protein